MCPTTMDGHPRFAIGPGERYRYEFIVDNRAGSYWFHPHPHGRTGKQVYAGLAGLFLVSDDEEAALGLPAGTRDLPLVIQDRNFDADNQFVYLGGADREPARRGGMGMGGMMGGRMMGGGMGSMMAGMMGVLGEQILVNGSMPALREVDRRAYRLRLLNASNTRTLKLGLERPDTAARDRQRRRPARGTAAARLRDAGAGRPRRAVGRLRRLGTGSEPTLRSLAFDGGIDMGAHDGRRGSLADGAAFDVQRFRVGAETAHADKLPARLSTVAAPQPRQAVNFDRPKVFELTMGMMVWGINGASFDMLGASELETVKLGTQEIWEFRNDGRGSMMGMVMPHSMHVHGLQFRVIGRSVSRRFAGDYDTVKAGLVDEGWKDTVLVMPGERVRVLLRFEDLHRACSSTTATCSSMRTPA